MPHHSLTSQAELLTFLVISQLFERYSTGQWMTIEGIVECSTFAPGHSYDSNDVVRRSMLASRALKLEQDIETEGIIEIRGAELLSMLDDKIRLDLSCSPARDIFERSIAHLRRTRWYV